MNQQVTEYINGAAERKEILQTIRQLIHDTVPTVTEEFKWGKPVFRAGKDFAYFNISKAYVTLGFFDYKNLNDPDNLLEGTGKSMRHIKLKATSDIDRNLLREWFKSASA